MNLHQHVPEERHSGSYMFIDCGMIKMTPQKNNMSGKKNFLLLFAYT